MADKILLELNDVSKSYNSGGHKLEILKGYNLQVREGEIIALVAPSGSGKTTLLQIIGLLDKPDSGEIILCGKNMASANDKLRTSARRRNLGFVYQFHNLLPDFSALENIMMPLLIKGIAKREAKDRAMQLLELLKLSERAEHRPATLSGGEQQRVAILRAIVHAPRLLLADEPTGNLDPTNAGMVFDILLNLARQTGLSTIIATHNPELAKRMDRVIGIV